MGVGTRTMHGYGGEGVRQAEDRGNATLPGYMRTLEFFCRLITVILAVIAWSILLR